MTQTWVSVTLEGGPCHGQIVHVSPIPGGLMPLTFAACLPASERDGPAPWPDDYHSYIRVGNGQSRRYRYWRDGLNL